MNAETIVIHYPLYPSKDKEDYVTYFIDKIKHFDTACMLCNNNNSNGLYHMGIQL